MAEPKLSELQTLFFKAVSGKEVTEDLLEWIEPGGKITHARKAVAIYQRAYKARQTEALGETYDAVWTVLGDDAFFLVAQTYIDRYPSQSYNLSNFGLQFPEFLIQETALLEDFPFLGDLAKYERLFQKTFHTRRDLASSGKQSVNETTQLIFPTHLEILMSEYDVYQIWKNRENPEAGLDIESIKRSVGISLFRNSEGYVQVQVWKAWQAETLQKLRQGATLKESTQSLINCSEDEVFKFFTELMSSGLILG